jgi:Uma2 family endonuclease
MIALRKTKSWRPFTVDEFFDLPDDPRHKKHVLLWGEIIAMSPPSPRNSALQVNVGALLRQHLRATRPGCLVGAEAGVIPHMGADVNYLQPDLLVTCESLDDRSRTFKEPLLVIEILSPSNQSEIRAKLSLYTSIPSIAEIVFLHSTRQRAEIWRKPPSGNWGKEAELVDRGETIRLKSIGFEAPMAALYEQIGVD